jgi:hypothetical protein
MNQSFNIVNKQYERGRNSSTSIDDSIHLNGTAFSLQSFVDDIPFEFNRKYQTIFVVSFCLSNKEFILGFSVM